MTSARTGFKAMMFAAASLVSINVFAQTFQQPPLLTGRMKMGIVQTEEHGEKTRELSIQEARIEIRRRLIGAESDKVCVDGHLDIDLRPLVGKSKAQQALIDEVNEGIETVVRLKTAAAMSAALSRQAGRTVIVNPKDVTVSEATLAGAQAAFTAPDKGYEGPGGVEGFAKYATRAAVMVDTSIRQAYNKISFGGCADGQGRVEITVGKANPTTFVQDSYQHPFISGPMVRAQLNFKRVSFYVELKNDRGSVISPEGDAAGMLANEVSRGKNILTYDPNFMEAGAILNLQVARLIAAINKKEGDEISYVAHIDNRDMDSARRFVGFSAQVVIQRYRNQEGQMERTTSTDFLVFKDLFGRLNLSAERFQRTGERDGQNLYFRMSKVGAEVRLMDQLFHFPIKTSIGGEAFWNKHADRYIPNEMHVNKGGLIFSRLRF